MLLAASTEQLPRVALLCRIKGLQAGLLCHAASWIPTSGFIMLQAAGVLLVADSEMSAAAAAKAVRSAGEAKCGRAILYLNVCRNCLPAIVVCFFVCSAAQHAVLQVAAVRPCCTTMPCLALQHCTAIRCAALQASLSLPHHLT